LFKREVKMYFKKLLSLSTMLDESPFFMELSVKEREKLIAELLHTYPQLSEQGSADIEVGYEASWLIKQDY
jgi:hypothetical protein